jgi:hypothetical protein
METAPALDIEAGGEELLVRKSHPNEIEKTPYFVWIQKVRGDGR